MFEKVRKAGRAKSILAIVVFGLIVLVFIFMGVAPDTGNFSGTGTAATVNGKVISYYDLQEKLRINESQMNRDMSKLPAAQRQQELNKMRREALEQLVNFEVLYQTAVKSGVYATPNAVSDLIFNIGGFQEDGQFRRERYFSYLEQTRMTPSQFESRVEKDVVIQQVRNLFVSAWKNPKVIMQLNEELQDTKLNIEFAKIDSKKINITPSPDEVNQFIASTEGAAKIKANYEANVEQYTAPVEVKARHILIKGSDAAAEKQIKTIQEQVSSKDFAELAKEFSQDDGSKINGGDLGYFSKGRMVREFEDVAFSLPVGQVSEPVKSSFGFHLIKVEDRRGGEKKSLESVQTEIAKNLLAEEMTDKAHAELSELLKENKSIDGFMKKMGLTWEETGEFPLSQFFVPKIEAGDEVIQRALKLKVGQVDSEILRAGPVSYVLRLKSLKSPSSSLPKDSPENMWGAVGGGLDALGAWLEENRKSAKIQTNELVLSQ